MLVCNEFVNFVLWYEEPPVFTPFPAIFLTIWLAPVLAAPAKAANPMVFAMVGPNTRPRDRMEVNKLPPTCFF